jgi:hypothetical protein
MNATIVDDAMKFVPEHDKSKDESNNYQEEEAEQRMTNKLF